MSEPRYELVVGIEVHLQLRTRTKMFCSCPNDFHAEPNTLVCPVCLAEPGALPVINAEAYRLAILAARSLGAEVNRNTSFDRKNYFYPDLPKGYQITQFFHPIAKGGGIEIPATGGGMRNVRLQRIHIEEDSGKMTHQDSLGESWLDFNRAGVPLIEIVTEPDIRSADEAHAYLSELRLLMRHLRVSDCEMQEGSLRCDLNINLRFPELNKATAISEVKNLNSFSQVRECIKAEESRQLSDFVNKGATKDNTKKATFGWDEAAGKTVLQRTKEGLADYRYFPEPDLPPFHITDALMSRIPLYESPRSAERRLREALGLEPYHASVLVQAGPDLVGAIDALVHLGHDPVSVGNLLTNEVLEIMNSKQVDFASLGLTTPRLSDLMGMITRKEFSMRVARQVLALMVEESADASDVIQRHGLKQVDDTSELEAHCHSVIREFPKAAADFKSGKANALNGLMGRVMQRTQGKANPQIIKDKLIEFLSGGHD
ncbi:MAG: Asp-tRNA(Asn)/Glu-tRNA(Gln) amidotransferase subunit GatB [Planctomycetota bacterium]